MLGCVLVTLHPAPRAFPGIFFSAGEPSRRETFAARDIRGARRSRRETCAARDVRESRFREELCSDQGDERGDSAMAASKVRRLQQSARGM